MKNWLRQRREQLHLSQEDVISKLQLQGINVSRSSLSNWENQKFNPPLEETEFRNAIAQVLSMSVSELLTMAGYEINETKSRESVTAAAIVERLPPAAKEMAMDYLSMLEKKYVKSG